MILYEMLDAILIKVFADKFDKIITGNKTGNIHLNIIAARSDICS